MWHPAGRPGGGAEPHYHDADEVWIFASGHGEAWVDGTTYDVTPNTAVYTPMGTVHRFQMFTDFYNASVVTRLERQKRADHLLVEHGNGELSYWDVHNEHPEISWSSLWGKVWYESYPEPDYVWQSTSATSEFEPKLSLAPLTFGTLKAAFYAMLLATPLAIAAVLAQ